MKATGSTRYTVKTRSGREVSVDPGNLQPAPGAEHSSRSRNSGAKKSCGFAVGILGEEGIQDSARSFVEEHGRPREYAKLLRADGTITNAGWAKLGDDIPKIERNALGWLRKTFEDARDEGHSGEDLVGTLWYDPADQRQLELLELASPSPGRGERIDFQDTGFGNFRDAYDGVSRFGKLLLGGAIVFFDVDEEF